MDEIFISYRADDTKAWAIHLHEALVDRFGAQHIYFDKENLLTGNWRVQLAERLQACKVFVLLIGRGWVQAVDAHGQPRLQQKEDVHRLEVATVLARSDVLVIPLLFDDVQLPLAGSLPSDLQALCDHQARRVHDLKAHRDLVINALAIDIAKASGLLVQDTSPNPVKALAVGRPAPLSWPGSRLSAWLQAFAIAFAMAFATAVLSYVVGSPLPEGGYPMVFAACLALVFVARAIGARWVSRRGRSSNPRE